MPATIEAFQLAMALLQNKVMDSLVESDCIDGRDAPIDSPEVLHDQLACL